MKTHSAKSIRILAPDHILGNEASSHDVFLMFLMTVFIPQRLSAIRKNTVLLKMTNCIVLQLIVMTESNQSVSDLLKTQVH